MRTFVALTVSAVLLGFTGHVHAARLLSSPLPTNTNSSGGCYIRNTGTTPVDVEVSLFANNGVVVTFDGCNTAPLAGGRTCVVLASLPDDSYAACSVSAGSVLKLRGTLEVREEHPFPKTLVSEELR
jgi:hypothetical protein